MVNIVKLLHRLARPQALGTLVAVLCTFAPTHVSASDLSEVECGLTLETRSRELAGPFEDFWRAVSAKADSSAHLACSVARMTGQLLGAAAAEPATDYQAGIRRSSEVNSAVALMYARAAEDGEELLDALDVVRAPATLELHFVQTRSILRRLVELEKSAAERGAWASCAAEARLGRACNVPERSVTFVRGLMGTLQSIGEELKRYDAARLRIAEVLATQGVKVRPLDLACLK